MTDKKQIPLKRITIDKLQIKIKELFDKSRKDIYPATGQLLKKNITTFKLKRKDHFYKYIKLERLTGMDFSGSKELCGENLRMERLEIVDDGFLVLQYNMPHINIPDGDTIKNAVTIEKCIFNDVSIKVGSEEKIKNLKQSNIHEEISKVNISMTFDSNRFEKLALILHKYKPKIKSQTFVYEYKYSAKLINENDIQELVIHDEYPDVIAWGIQERIGERIVQDYDDKIGSYRDEYKKSRIRVAWEKIENNKSVLMEFKNLAINKNDRFQESTINYHIARCDEQFMNLETEMHFWQNKAIMWLGRILSRHGTSWIRPLACIFAFNLLASSIIFLIIHYTGPFSLAQSDLWYIFGQLHNPFSTPLSLVQGIYEKLSYSFLGIPYLWITFFVLLSKAFYAMCIYEFVRVARRFTLN